MDRAERAEGTVIAARTKLVLLASLFAVPIVASLLAYRYARLQPTANYGELLLPPSPITLHVLGGEGGKPFNFASLSGHWVLVMADAGECPKGCREKLMTLRQVRLALGREANRVERVFVADDGRAPDPKALLGYEGTLVAIRPADVKLPPGAGSDREHIYLIDPRGNVMMRWGAAPDWKRMHKDLQRLLKASQIG
jgi:cytochrome oxidase Cu insertion factor (SCO1/SenC/PrrC family)